jgi:hypothetical protein
MQLKISSRRFARAMFVALAIGTGFVVIAPVQAALPSAERAAETHKPAVEASRFTLIAPPTESRIDIDEGHAADSGQAPVALWLFAAAALLLPGSGMLAAVRRHIRRPTRI